MEGGSMEDWWRRLGVGQLQVAPEQLLPLPGRSPIVPESLPLPGLPKEAPGRLPQLPGLVGASERRCEFPLPLEGRPPLEGLGREAAWLDPPLGGLVSELPLVAKAGRGPEELSPDAGCRWHWQAVGGIGSVDGSAIRKAFRGGGGGAIPSEEEPFQFPPPRSNSHDLDGGGGTSRLHIWEASPPPRQLAPPFPHISYMEGGSLAVRLCPVLGRSSRSG